MQTKRILASVGIMGATALGAILSPSNAIAHTSRPKPCIVPRVTGDSLPAARRRIERAGCRVGRVIRPKVASGRLVVRSETPKPSRRQRKHGTRVRLVLRVKQAKASTVGVTLPTATTPTTTTPTAAPNVPAPTVRASIDPDYTQDPANPLDVTWTYSASATGATSVALPSGVLAFSVTPNTGGLGPVGGCSINVDATTTGGTCTVDLPSYGAYTITVTYTGSGSTVAPATFTENETISAPPSPPPAPTPTTTSLSYVSFSGIGGSYLVTLNLLANAPLPWEYTTTITDITTGESSTSPVWDDESSPTTQTVDVAFETSGVPAGDVAVSALGTVSDTDTICVSATTLASTVGGVQYASSTSPSVQVWPANGENAC